MARRKPILSEDEILKFRDFCLEHESKGNPPGNRYSHNIDLYRGIYFYHSVGGNWYLRRDWRTQWNEKFPQYPVDLQSTLPPKKERVKPEELHYLVSSLAEYDNTVWGIEWRTDMRRWSLFRIDRTAQPPSPPIYEAKQWRNTNDAYEELNDLYRAFVHSCAKCGTDWRLTPRYRDGNNTMRCGGCHRTDKEISALD